MAGSQTDKKSDMTGDSAPFLASYVTTGAPIPAGFICVVPIESVTKVSETRIRIDKNFDLTDGKFIRQPGSDVKSGSLILKQG